MSVKPQKTVVQQEEVVVPDLTIKELLGAIPSHCFKRSALRSSQYILYDVIAIAAIWKAATFCDSFITSEHISLPSPYLYLTARCVLWALYGFAAGLPATGLWVIGHECGHQAFSESKFINNSVGWLIHSVLGVPYHSWKISHGRHHASTGHMTRDEVFVPRTRSQLGLPPFSPQGENLIGSSVTQEIKEALHEALGDSPIGAILGPASYLIIGWPAYLLRNASGQKRFPKETNHFNPSAVIFAPHQRFDVMISTVGILCWLTGLAAWSYFRGFAEVFKIYLVPYLWVNHWLILIVFLQHTDPLLPHYRAAEYTFPRGALTTMDRNLLGDCGKLIGWIGTHATHGISETHVLHHVSSKIPHYNAWEASDALRKLTESRGMKLEGAPGGWFEMYRVYRECKFVEDQGDVLFYKNEYGLAAARPVITSHASDSGVEVDTK